MRLRTVPDRPADEEAVESLRRHRVERQPPQRAVVEARGRARRPSLRAAAPDGERRGGAASPGGDEIREQLGRFLQVRGEDRRRLAARSTIASHEASSEPSSTKMASTSQSVPAEAARRRSARRGRVAALKYTGTTTLISG